MNGQRSPDERFDQVESTLEQLSNSFRHLLTAQVLINDAQKRSEKLIERLAELGIETNQRIDKLSDKVDSLADGVKHTDENLAALSDKVDALADIVRNWYERHGNGQHPS